MRVSIFLCQCLHKVYLPPEQRTANGEAIAQFNRAVAVDPRVEQVLLPIRDGITLIRRVL